MKSKTQVCNVAAAIVFILFPAVLPNLSAPMQAQKPVDVRQERHVIPGYVEPNTPGAPGITASAKLTGAITDPAAFDNGVLNLNKAIYVRFFDRNRVTPPKAIVLLLPELEAGAASLRIVAKEIVSFSGGDFEAWAIDHRGNLLEDLVPMVQAESAMTLTAASDALKAYMSNPAGRGGVLAADPLLAASFASEWGLDVYLRDIRAIVDEAHRTGASIYLGGHSGGAVHSQMFAAYDFGDVAGFELLKGLVFIGGTNNPSAPPISDEDYLNGTAANPGLNRLRSPGTRPFITDPTGGPRAPTFQIIEIGSLFTIIDPDDTTVQKLFPFFERIPATNMAFMGLLLDDEFQAAPVARVSIGFLKIPEGGKLSDVATRIGDDPAKINPNGLWAPKNPGPDKVLQWDPRARFLSSLGPEFAQDEEVSTVQSLMRNALLITAAEGGEPTLNDTNSNQWFTPKRLQLDLQKASDLGRTQTTQAVIDAQKARGGNRINLTKNQRVNLPMLGIHATYAGALADEASFQTYRSFTRSKRAKFSYSELQFYTNTDMLTSLEPMEKGRKNVPELIVEFVRRNK